MLPFLIPALASIGSGIAGALSNRKGSRTSTSTSSTSTAYSPEDSGLASLLRQRAMARLNTNPAQALQAYQTQGIQGINQAYDPIMESINASLTSRGLGTSPVAGAADTRLQLARGGDIARLNTSLPLVGREMENQDFSTISAFLNAQPRTVTQTGTGVAPGSAAGSGIGSAAEMLAFLWGKGLFGGKAPGGG